MEHTSAVPQHAPPAVTPKPSSRRLDIQGLRALAVLLVIIFHAGLPLSGGFAGVDVFFVISGFVITSMLLAELELHNRLNLPQFYLRRVRRLLPALATLSGTVAVVAMLINPIGTQITTAFTGMATSLFVANGYLYRAAPGYFSPGAEFNPMLHTWSLAVEEQFYFLFPLLLAFGWRMAGSSARSLVRRWSVVALIVVMMGLSFWISCAMSYGQALLPGVSAPAQFAFFSSPTRAWEFAAGALLAFGMVWLRQLPGRVTLGAGVTGLVLMGWSAFCLDGSMRFPGWVAWAPVGATVLMIIGGSAGDNRVTRLFSTPVAVWIGDRSYGWYLWHWPFVVFARALLPDSGVALVVASALSLLPAWASYRWIETPIRSVKNPSTASTIRLAALCILIPIALFGTLLLAHRGISTSPGAANVEEGLRLHIDEVRGCEGIRPLQAGKQENCTWRVPQARGTVVLLGDSNAGHFTEPVVRAGNAAGYDVTVATLPACPFVDLEMVGNGVRNARCEAFVAGALTEFEKYAPSLIILAAASDGYIEETSTTLRATPQGALAQTPDDKARLWTEGVSAVLARMTRVAPVLVVHPVPRFRTWTLSSCAAYKVWLDPAACAGTSPRMVVDEWRKRAVASEMVAIARHPGASGLDVTDLLCPSATCQVAQNGVWTFRDGAHLSVQGALSLTDPFRAAIEKNARPTRH